MSAEYHAEDWAKGETKEAIQEEIDRLKSLWTLKHPNPFAKNADWAYRREMTLRKILNERLFF
jgi:hypothetical protein